MNCVFKETDVLTRQTIKSLMQSSGITNMLQLISKERALLLKADAIHKNSIKAT